MIRVRCFVSQDLCELRGEFEALQRVQEEQEEALHRRDRELTALRGVLDEEISAHARDVEALQEEHQQEIHRLREATQEAKKASFYIVFYLVISLSLLYVNKANSSAPECGSAGPEGSGGGGRESSRSDADLRAEADDQWSGGSDLLPKPSHPAGEAPHRACGAADGETQHDPLLQLRCEQCQLQHPCLSC